MEWLNQFNWAQEVVWLDLAIVYLLPLLAKVGVAEAYQSVAALGIIYLGATLVALVFILILLKLFGGGGKQKKVVTEAAQPDISSELESEPISLFERLKRGLAKTQSSLVGRVDSLLCGQSVIDEDLIEDLEEILITADLGVQTTQKLIASLESGQAKGTLKSPDQIRQLLMDELRNILQFESRPLQVEGHSPFVIMVVGVNGVGKTTTIGKLANQFAQEGKKVVLGAGDTFRAAAAEQLEIWGERAGVDVIRHAEGTDPGAVAFQAAATVKPDHQTKPIQTSLAQSDVSHQSLHQYQYNVPAHSIQRRWR